MSPWQREPAAEVVGLGTAVHWLQASPPGVNSLAELRQVAAARCAFLHGGAPEDWIVQADWDAARPFVCAAVRREQEPDAGWQSAWQVVRRQAQAGGWHALESEGHVALWHVRQGHVDAISAFAIGEVGNAAAAVEQRMRLEVVNHFALAAGAIRWHRVPAEPVRHQTNRTRRAATGMTLAAVAACAVLAWEAWDAATQLAHTRLELQAAQRRNATPRPRTEAKPAPADRQGWNRIARQLNTPWPALLDALESGTPDHVALVSIEPDARQSSVRIQAEAKQLDALLEYAQQLAAAPLFQHVSLAKHETNEQDSNKPVRLTIDARVAPAEVPR